MDVLDAIKKRSIRVCAKENVSEKDVAKVVNAPKNIKPVAIIPVRYSAEKRVASDRRRVSEIVHKETF